MCCETALVFLMFSMFTKNKKIQRRPTLPGGLPPSTISAEGLNFCVRYGNRCDPFAFVTGLCPNPIVSDAFPERIAGRSNAMSTKFARPYGSEQICVAKLRCPNLLRASLLRIENGKLRIILSFLSLSHIKF